MRSIKTAVVLLISFFIILTQVSCSTKNAKDVIKQDDKGSSEKDVTITFSIGKDPTGANQKVIEIFEQKNPGIKVNYQEMPSNATQHHDAYVTALSGGDNSVDVYAIDITWPSEFASAGWLMPLTKLFEESRREEYLSGPIDGVTYKGTVYAVPFQTGAGVLYYRTDLIPKSPKTWEELFEISKKLMSEKKIEYGFVFQGSQYEGIVCNALEYIWSNGGEILDETDVVLESENSLEALNIFKNMLAIAPKGVTAYTEPESLAVFKAGKAAFMRNWPNAWNQLNSDDSLVKGKVGIMPIPKGPKGENSGTSTLGGWNLAINKNSRNSNAAWKLIDFLAGEEAQAIRAIKGGYLPVLKSTYKDVEVLRANPHFEKLYDVFVNAKPRPVSPYYSKISRVMQVNIHRILTGGIETEEGLEVMAQGIKEIVGD